VLYEEGEIIFDFNDEEQDWKESFERMFASNANVWNIIKQA